MRRLILMLGLLLLVLPVLAIDDDLIAEEAAKYPTLARLAEAVIPVADRADLARRFLGVSSIPIPPQSASPRQGRSTAVRAG